MNMNEFRAEVFRRDFVVGNKMLEKLIFRRKINFGFFFDTGLHYYKNTFVTKIITILSFHQIRENTFYFQRNSYFCAKPK